MKCDEIGILLSAYVDGEVTPEEKQRVEEHISVCQSCQAIMAGFADLHTLCQEMEKKEAPPGFRQRVTQRIEAKPRFALNWRRLPKLVYVFSVALLLILGGTLLALHFRQPTFQESWEQASLEIDVYAEDFLFGSSEFSEDELFSLGEMSIAEEILNTIDFSEADTSFFFGDRPRGMRLVLKGGRDAQSVG